MEENNRSVNLIVTGGTFTDIQGSYYNIQNAPQESGIFALSQAISTGAMYDSAVRYPAGACHPGTREKIIETILKWINDPSPSLDVLWLCGPAGSGKSAIMHTVAEKLRELHKERYGGSFFFARGVPGRDQDTPLFSTLAYQLATNFPAMREPINQAMTADLTLPSKSTQVQFKLLLIEPLTLCPDPPSLPPIMIIDGLDECGNSRTQRQILSLIANAITATHIPLRFLIASRPEFWIRDTFDRPPLVDITLLLNLSDSEHSYNTYNDIKNYLQDGFDKIYENNLDVMSCVQKPWPLERVIHDLAYNASGQFIYASTVLKFVGDESDFVDPQKQLEIVSNPGPLRASAFSDLDQLYTRILSVYPRRDKLVQVLGGLLIDSSPQSVGVCLGIDAPELSLILRVISSLIYRPDSHRYKSDGQDLDLIYGLPDDRISFCHLSFSEFLTDKNRSGLFSISKKAVLKNFFTGIEDIISSTLNGSRKDLDSMKIIVNNLTYIDFFELSSARMKIFIHNLELALQSFSRSKILVETPLLLRFMRYIRHEVQDIHWQYDYLAIGETAIHQILQKVKSIADDCIQEILSTSGITALDDITYFVCHGMHLRGKTLDEIALLHGFNEEKAKTFLTHNAPLVFSRFQRDNTPFFRRYSLGEDVWDFLCTESCGGRFHQYFRTRFIRTCLHFLIILLDNWEPDGPRLDGSTMTRDQLIHEDSIVAKFLETHSISDLRFNEDPQDQQSFKDFIETLCTGDNHRKFRIQDPYKSQTTGIIPIVRWLHRQLNQNPLSLLLEDNKNLRLKMLNTMEHICSTSILPKFQIPFYSDDEKEEKKWLLSLTFPPPLVGHHSRKESGIPPYNITPSHQYPYPDDKLRDARNFVMLILREEAMVNPHLDCAQFSTIMLEFYLNYHINFLHPQINTVLPPGPFYPEIISFSVWFEYSKPTKKIQAALWTMHYLCSKENLPWRPPPGFCSGAIDFLEKYELDQEGELTSWLDDLVPRQLRDDSRPADCLGTPYWLVHVDWSNLQGFVPDDDSNE